MSAITNKLPEFGVNCLIPPRYSVDGASLNRSPYHIDISYFVERFSLTPKRITLLMGLLDYRSKLYNIGIVNGFQWINGSFLEDIEKLENREPNDIDVITFYFLVDPIDQKSLLDNNANIFNSRYLKENYFIDGYYMQLGLPLDLQQTKAIAYWYSMWSHRRDGQWKGFVQISLDPDSDKKASDFMVRLEGESDA